MLENEKLLRDILFIFKEQKLKDEQIHDLFENCYLLVEDWFEIKGQDYKSIHFCKSLILPVMEKYIKASKKDYLPELYKLYMKMYALCGRRDLECFIDYMESDRVYRVLDSRRSVLMPFVDSLNRLLYDDKLKMVVASYPPSTGKCIDENTLIFTPKGYIPIKNINIGDEVYSMKDKEIVKENVLNKWNTVKKQVIFTTKSGRKISVSPEHNMLTTGGYKPANEIYKGEYFYSLLYQKQLEEKEINEDELIYITCMIFEGHCKFGRLSYTGENNEITNEFLKSCDNLGIQYYPQYKKDNKAVSYRLRANNKNIAYNLLKKYKINDELCYTKRLPIEFFTLSEKQKYKFISIMFATDGYITKADVGICLANEFLIDDIQKILNSCGVYCSKHDKYCGEFKSWRLFIPKDFVLKLFDNCYFYQKENKKELVSKNLILNRNNLSVRYPFKLLENLQPTGVRKGYIEELRYERKNDRSPIKFEKYVKAYPELEKHLYKDFFWEEITNIEYSNEMINMVDIEVSNTHNFIANNFVSHNSFCMNYFTAFCFGIDINNSVLRISYSDDLVSGFSRSIKDIISSQLFADIFPNFVLYGGKVFDKDKETDWKIKGADLITNHYARTRGGPITGVRANTAIIIDDITKGAEEATSIDVHNNIYNKWTTEWINRYDNRPNKPRTKFVVAGTMWCPDDLLNRVREDEEKYSTLRPSKKYKYVWETDDAIFIRIPALDENEESTCPSVSSTQEYLRLRDKMDPYLFSCVYQQDPIAPSGLEFNWDLINTYDTLPKNENGTPQCTPYAFASLDPGRKGKDYVSMPILVGNEQTYYMIDALYQQKAMTELYDTIIERIIAYKIVKLTIENNTDTSLKAIIEMKLKEKQYPFCEIVEKFQTINKEKRIKDTRGIIKRQIFFKNKNLLSPNSEYGKFMKDFTNYSFDYPNKHDDAPDSLALFTTEIILGNSILPEAIPVNRSDIRF